MTELKDLASSCNRAMVNGYTSGKLTLPFSFLFPFSKGSSYRKEYAPFSEEFCNTRTQTGSHKNCFPLKKKKKNYPYTLKKLYWYSNPKTSATSIPAIMTYEKGRLCPPYWWFSHIVAFDNNSLPQDAHLSSYGCFSCLKII